MQDKYYNTLKMMGVSAMGSLFFADALNLMHITINQEVKKSQRAIILNTVIMGKPFKEWYIHFVGIGIKNKQQYFNAESETSELFSKKAIEFDKTESYHFKTLLELVLQEYYKRERVLG